MKDAAGPGFLTSALFFLEAQAAAAFIWLRADPGRGILSLLLIMIAVTAAAGVLLNSCARVLAARTGRSRRSFIPGLVACLSPIILLDLVFIQFFVFLGDIETVLAWVSAAACLYLTAVFVSRTALGPTPFEPRTSPAILFTASFLLYAFLASGLVFPPQPFSGDEPHYLLITRSLVSDGDINVHNDYRDGEYLPFYPGSLDTHAFPGKKGPGYEYSRHLPGISVAILPFYLAGELAGKTFAPGAGKAALRRGILIFASRLAMCLLAAALGAAFFLLALKITGRAGPSLLAWAVFSFASPLVYFSQLIYPEIPAAIVSVLIFRLVILDKSPGPRAFRLAGAGIAVLPWFGVKYILLSAVLFALCIPALGRGSLRRRDGLLGLCPLPFLSAVAFLLFFWTLYGKVAPSAVYGDSFPPGHFSYAAESGARIVEAIRFGAGYFFDQRFGIIPHAPVFFLLFAGAALLFRRLREAAIPMGILFAAYWALCAATRIWGGHCPPGRLLLPVIWIPMIFVAEAFAAAEGRTRSAILTLTIGASAVMAFAGLRDPRLLYHDHIYTILSGPETYSRLLAALGNSFVDLRPWAPSFANWDAAKSPATWVWLLMAASIIAAFMNKRRAGAPRSPAPAPGIRVAIVLAMAAAIAGYAFFDVHLAGAVPAGNGIAVLFQDGNANGMEPGGFWTKGDRETTVLITSPVRLTRISLTLRSPRSGRTRVRAGMSRKDGVRSGDGPPVRIDFERPVGFRVRGAYFYNLRIEDSDSFIPHLLDRRSDDGRVLGVFVSLAAS